MPPPIRLHRALVIFLLLPLLALLQIGSHAMGAVRRDYQWRPHRVGAEFGTGAYANDGGRRRNSVCYASEPTQAHSPLQGYGLRPLQRPPNVVVAVGRKDEGLGNVDTLRGVTAANASVWGSVSADCRQSHRSGHDLISALTREL